jgi:endonuclease YncB( thermonuclease family)
VESARLLERRGAGQADRVRVEGKGPLGTLIGLCRADGWDLGADMVEAGMAWAFTRYSSDYIEEEKSAIGARIGVHAHDCEKAWASRARGRGDK